MVQSTNSRGVVLAASFGTVVALIGFTTAFPTLGPLSHDLGGGVDGQSWASSGISLGLAASLLTLGSLADRRGHRRVFAWSAVAMTVAAGVSAAAPSLVVFVAARVVHGIGAAGVIAAGLGAIGQVTSRGPERTRATAVWGAALGTGIALGPVLAGLVMLVSGWRTTYALDALLSLAAVGVGTLMPTAGTGSGSARQARFDLPGTAAMAATIALLTAGLVAGRTSWTSGRTLAFLGAGLVGLAAFVAAEHLQRTPMLGLEHFRRPAFRLSLVSAVATGFSMIGLTSYLPLLLEDQVAATPLLGGGVLSLWSVVGVAVALLSRRLDDAIPSSTRLAVGLGLCGLGCLALVGFRDGSSVWALAPGLAVGGVGIGLTNAALGRIAVESVPAGAAALGSGANNTARYIGSSLGIAVLVSVIAGAHSTTAGWHEASVTAGVVALVAAGWALLERTRRAAPSGHVHAVPGP